MAGDRNSSSFLLTVAERIRTVAVAAFTSSVGVTWVRRRVAHWRGMPWRQQRMQGGVLLVIAALVHFVLTGRGPGWPEYIIPLIGLVIGLLAAVSALLTPNGGTT